MLRSYINLENWTRAGTFCSKRANRPSETKQTISYGSARKSVKPNFGSKRKEWTLKKDAFACQQLSALAVMNHTACQQNPNFDVEYATKLAKRGLTKNTWEAARRAA